MATLPSPHPLAKESRKVYEYSEKFPEEKTAPFTTEDMRVYLDGSSVDKGVGGVAVLMRGEVVVRKKRLHLGSDEEHTVQS